MKLKTLLLVILIITSATKVSAKGGIPLIYSDGEEVEKILDLPQRDEFMIQANDGKWYHADLGVLHEQFSIFWIPLFNYGTERYVLYTDKKSANMILLMQTWIQKKLHICKVNLVVFLRTQNCLSGMHGEASC